jgi:O-antigen/teichoic acid export membrane protein
MPDSADKVDRSVGARSAAEPPPSASGSVLHYAVRNSLFSGFGTVFTFIISFVFAGLTIRFLGNTRGGYLMTLQAILGLNALVGGFGLGTPAIRQTAILFSKGDLAGARALVGSTTTVNVVSALVFALVTIISFPWVFTWSKLDPVYRTDALWATLFVAGSFLLTQAASSWQSIYQSLQRYDLSSSLATVFGLAAGIAGTIVLTLAPTMAAVALVGFCLAVVRLACDAYFSIRLLGGISRPTWRWAMIRPMLGFGGWTYLSSLGGFLFTNLDRLVVTAFLGSAAMPYYVLPQRLYSQVHTALSGQSRFLFPMFSAFGEAVRVEMERLEDRLRWFIALTSGAAYTGMALIGPLVLSQLVSAEYSRLAALPLILACVQGFFHAQEIVPYFYSWALGAGAPNTMADLVNGTLVILTAVLLVPHFGYLGASVAQLWIVGVSVAHTVWVRHLVSPGGPKFGWLRAYASPAMLVTVWVSLTNALVHFVPGGVVMYISYVAIGGLAGLATVWVVENSWFRSYDRWATLERAIAIPVGKAKGWVQAR